MCAALLFFSYTFITHVYYNREITDSEYKLLQDHKIKFRPHVTQYQYFKLCESIDRESVTKTKR